MQVIANTTILSNFAAAKRLDLLRQVWKIVHLPDQVHIEIQNGLQAGYRFYEDLTRSIHPLCEQGWLHLTTLDGIEELELYGELQEHLHAGEAACLSIASCRGWAFLSDDRAARAAANRLKVVVGGTIGVLVTSVKAHHISMDEANTLLFSMQRAGYYAPVQTLDELFL